MSDFRLPRLPRDVQLIDPKTGFPTVDLQRWWQSVVTKIETQEGSQDAILEALTTVEEAVETVEAAVVVVEAAAADAAASADTAQASADGANSVASLTNSGVTGCTITATDAGANVTVTISAHTRVYGDGTTVAVNGGSVTGQGYSVPLLYIYYDDAARAGGAVTYLATTNEATAAQTGDRHLVGATATPAAAAPPEIGDEVRVPGVGNIFI